MNIIKKLAAIISDLREWMFLKSMRSSFMH
ncbi:hypothetical protein HDC91_000425 [Mucilaginibacter sp. AK015]|nr:hypothetical protein [Mucilaginibacter sp. AK015]